ncbi:hypothetical protein [Streptomyces sp. NPDC008122]|uniref:hypothetical protein n=1 Tax=Streptomyces sp. NPDC008122 TaxID=3364810 RepID=UPI0036E5FA23
MSPAARITLYTSPNDGIVALPNGPGSNWADIALDLARFESADKGVHVLPMSDLDRVQKALDTLYTHANRFDIQVSTSHQAFIGDIGRGIAHRLNGSWTVEVGNCQLAPSDARTRLRFLWDSSNGPLSGTMRSYEGEVDAATFLYAEETGLELAVLRRPWDGQIVVGALASTTAFTSLDTVTPVSVAAPDLAGVLKQVAETLLPSYEHALAQAHFRLLERVLDQIRAAHAKGALPRIWSLNEDLCQHWYGLDQHLRRGLYGPLPEPLDDLLRTADVALSEGSAQDEEGAVRLLEHWLQQGTRLVDLVRPLDPDLAARAVTPLASPALPPGPPRQGRRPGASR